MTTAGETKDRPLVLITGGTRGLGLACAYHLAKANWDVVVTDISSQACQVYGEAASVEEIVSGLQDLGATSAFYAADLTDEGQAQDLVSRIERDIGQVDALVTMAGGDIGGDAADASGGKAPNNTAFVAHDDFLSVFNRNFFTCVYACRAVGQQMRERGRGKIVTIASVSAGVGVAEETSYAVAKAGVVHFTRCLATELRPYGINVNCVAPGATDTGRFRATLKNRGATDLVRLRKTGRLERLGQPEDVCKIVEFFLSTSADFVSGQVLRVDGGQFTGAI